MKTLLLATSAIAMMAIAPAFAENNVTTNTTTKVPSTVDQSHVESAQQSSNKAEVREGWEDTKDATARAWEDTKDAVSNAADSVAEGAEKAYDKTAEWLDTHTDIDAYVDNRVRLSASDVSGMDVYNMANDKIGDVSDIIMNKDGDIEKLVIESGGLMGLGAEKVAINYDAFEMRTEGQAGFYTSLTQDELQAMNEFEEEKMGADMYLASDLMDGNVVNDKMQEVAEVDNIIIEGGKATKLVVSYDGEGAVDTEGLVDFSDADISVDKDDHATFKISVK